MYTEYIYRYISNRWPKVQSSSLLMVKLVIFCRLMSILMYRRRRKNGFPLHPTTRKRNITGTANLFLHHWRDCPLYLVFTTNDSLLCIIKFVSASCIVILVILHIITLKRLLLERPVSQLSVEKNKTDLKYLSWFTFNNIFCP